MSNYYADYENQINNQYNGAIGNLDKLQAQDKLEIGQQHNQYRNQASVNAARNQMALKEQMAQQGLFKSGDNITASTQINNQRSSDINQTNMNESNAYGRLSQDKYRQMMEFEMQRQNALREALTRSKEWDYRDSRDKISDDRYKTEWDYKKQQDALSQSNWERQFAKTGSSGGGGSYGSTPTPSTKTNVWDEFSQQFGGSPSYAAQWLGKNQADIVDAVGQTEYNKMKDVAYQQQRNYNTDQKRKQEKKYQAY